MEKSGHGNLRPAEKTAGGKGRSNSPMNGFLAGRCPQGSERPIGDAKETA
ncbi:MAG: hypothetical protein LBK73_16685 [Treponema sp.]|nr:hypothetical protein [Treponema sp.]